MNGQDTSTRRSILKGGLLLAAPLALAGSAAAMAVPTDNATDEGALHDLHQQFMRHVSRGDQADLAALFDDPRRVDWGTDLQAIAPDHGATAPDLRIALDSRTALLRAPCIVERREPMARNCTLAQMAHVQGEGAIRHTERQMLALHFVRRASGWRIATAELRPV